MASSNGAESKPSPESQFISFIKDRLENRGTLNLQNLTGHLSSLPPHIRAKFGSSKTALKKFIKEHPETFTLDKKEYVEIAVPPSPESVKPKETSPKFTPVATQQPKPSTSNEQFNKTIAPPTKEPPVVIKEKASDLKDVKGKIYRIFEFFGFITVTNPITASIYFDVQSFENGTYKNLVEGKVKVGDIVHLNAYIGPDNCEAQYRASAVWRPEGSSSDASENGGDSKGLEFEGKGRIHNLFATYGFIAQSHAMKENVFFHLRIVSLEVAIEINDSKSLQDVLKIGDKVRFRAKPSDQKDSPVKWQATAVWMDKQEEAASSDISTNLDGNDIYMSSPENTFDSEFDTEHDTDEEVNDKEHPTKKKINESQAEFVDTSILKMGFKTKNVNSNPIAAGGAGGVTITKPPEHNLFQEPITEPKSRVIINQTGLLSAKSNNMATIVFGDQYTERALAVSDVVYLNGIRVVDFMWEIEDSQKISFDAVEEASNLEYRWKTILAWTGMKPNVKNYDLSVLNRLYEKAQKDHITLSSAITTINSSEQDSMVKQSPSHTVSSEWGSRDDESDKSEPNHTPPRQLMGPQPLNMPWQTLTPHRRPLNSLNNVISSNSLTSPINNSLRKSPSPVNSQIRDIFNQQVISRPTAMKSQPSFIGSNLSHHPKVSLTYSDVALQDRLSRNQPLISPVPTTNHELPNPIERPTFYHPVFTSVNPNDSQHVYRLETKIKELTQQVQLLEDMVNKRVSSQNFSEDMSTQTLPSAFKQNTINFTKPELNSRATQTMSTGSVMYNELFHDH